MIDSSQNILEQMQKTTIEINQSQQLNETPDISNFSGHGYAGRG